MRTLGHTEQFHLIAATGWLELGNWKEASLELDQLAPDSQSHADVLRVRWAICSASRDWARAIEMAQALAKSEPQDSFGSIHQAYALHELKRTQEAWDVLRPLADKFPQEYLVRYNLACYACQLGRREEALAWLAEAFRLGDKRTVRAMALKDADLSPLKAEIGALP